MHNIQYSNGVEVLKCSGEKQKKRLLAYARRYRQGLRIRRTEEPAKGAREAT